MKTKLNTKEIAIGAIGWFLFLCAGCADKDELSRAKENDDQYLYVTSSIMSRSPKGNKADWLYFEYTANHSCDYLYNRANPESEVIKLYNAGAKPEEVAAIYQSGGFVHHEDADELTYRRVGFYCADYQDSAFNKRTPHYSGADANFHMTLGIIIILAMQLIQPNTMACASVFRHGTYILREVESCAYPVL